MNSVHVAEPACRYARKNAVIRLEVRIMSTTETIEVNLPTEVQDFAKKCLGRSNPRSFLIPLLHRLQDIEGYLKSEHLREVAKLIGTTEAEVVGVASFTITSN